MGITNNQLEKGSSIIPQNENQINNFINIDGKEDVSILFSGQSENCCVGIVDMVNSTKISALLTPTKFCKYYGMFINSMTLIARHYNAIVVKNIGDGILFYFPNSANTSNEYKKNCLECCFAMIEVHDHVNKLLKNQGLPSLDYRVSSDFGTIVMAKSDTSINNDIFGPSVNMCSKINRNAEKNGIIIGGDQYEIMKKYHEFKFKSLKGFEMGFQQNYPMYRVTRTTPSCSGIVKKIIDSNKFSCNDRVNSALVAMGIEKAIVKLGIPKLSYVTDKFYEDYNLSLFDCYVAPVYFKTFLNDLYGSSYNVIVNLIGAELAELAELGDMSMELSEFMATLKSQNL